MRLRQFVVALSAAAAVLASAPGAATAQAGKYPDDPACERSALAKALIEHDADFADTLGSEADDYPGLQTVCADTNGDGTGDALWAISGGGSGGAMNAGLAVSSTSSNTMSIEHEQLGSHFVVGFVKGKPAIGTPRYARKDPNCCPSRGWRWHTYTPGKDGQVRESRLKTTERKRCPIKAEA